MIGWNETAGFPVLFTERLLLREFTMEDVPAVFAIFSRRVRVPVSPHDV